MRKILSLHWTFTGAGRCKAWTLSGDLCVAHTFRVKAAGIRSVLRLRRKPVRLESWIVDDELWTFGLITPTVSLYVTWTVGSGT